MWYKFSDGWFTYYINRQTGERKLTLDPGDVEETFMAQRNG